MVEWKLFALIVMAIAIGFLLGVRAQKGRQKNADTSGLDHRYFQGLNFLLNEEPDAAIDTFIEALEVNSETLDTHLALGNLLRKRGEAGRAVRIHQNLLARPALTPEQQQQAQLELARDYITAGLLDRAESLLQELAEAASLPTRTLCLEHLAEIYRDEREWEKAIHTVDLLGGRRFAKLPQKWRVAQAHFCCELAEEALVRSDYLSVRRNLKLAFAYDKSSVRASLLLGDLEHRLGNYREALKVLKRIPEQDPNYIPEALSLIISSYEKLGKSSELNRYLNQLLEDYPSSSLILSLAERVSKEKGESAAAGFIGDKLQARPSLRGVGRLLEFQHGVNGHPDENLALVKSLIDQLLVARCAYHCESCGFSGNQLHWLCPSCKSWGSIKAVRGAEGE